MKQRGKRILAIAGIILLLGMYVVVFILGITGREETKGALMAAIACTVIIPVLIYAMMLMAKILGSRKDVSAEEKEDP